MKRGGQFGAIFGLMVGLVEPAIARPVSTAAPPSRSVNLAAACAALGRSSTEVARRFAAIPDAPTTILNAAVIPAGGNGNAVERDYPGHCRISYSDYSLYESWNLKGWPVETIVRGNTVMRDGKIVGAPGHGKYLTRKLNHKST